MSSSYRKTLEAIQHNTLRIIFKTTWDITSISELRQRAKVHNIEDWLKNLNEKYFKESLFSPLIETLIEDYLSFGEKIVLDNLTTKTPLFATIAKSKNNSTVP